MLTVAFSQARSLESSQEEVEVELFGGQGWGNKGLGGHASTGWGNAASTHDSLNRSTALLEDSLRTVAATEEVSGCEQSS